MTKGGNGKHNVLERLIFGEKRKQHASPSRHRSATRHGSNAADVSSSGGGDGATANKNRINIHDWANWRMHLNEQMGVEMSESTDLSQLRQYLHSNQFYQQHSRDPTSGCYNGVRLLFSIPHAKLKSEFNDGSRSGSNKHANMNVSDAAILIPTNAQLHMDDRPMTSVNSVSVAPPAIIDKTISQLLPKNLIRNAGDFLQTNEQMVAADMAQTRRSMRASYTATDRVHSTLQKAVKDGNVLEKIKAFEMQAAAAQAETTPKLIGGCISSSSINNRIQPVTSPIQSATHRALSPAVVHPMQHPVSPMPMRHEPQQQQQQQQYIRSHRSRHVHPIQQHREGHLGPVVGRESRKGAHVLEPAHGDIILKRRPPSQKTIIDDDYSMTLMSSMALTASQSHHHHHRQHHHHRASASRSRHRQEKVHDKRSSSQHDNVHKKHQHKQKERTTPTPTPTQPSSNKTSSRRRWLKGRKETPTEPISENSKQEISEIKSSKSTKNKKKNVEKEKSQSSKKATPSESKEKTPPTTDNNRVNGVANSTVSEPIESEAISPEPPSKIDEEHESDREGETSENQTNLTSPKEEDEEEEEIIQQKECDTGVTTNVERRSSKTKCHQKLSSTDGEILSKIEDDTRFSRPTDDHAHRSELNDEDDEYKSEGDVFIEESPVTTINPQQISNAIRRHSSQCSAEELTSDRRWQWSKESGGLIEKSNRKKKQIPITIITRKSAKEEEQMVYEIPESEQTSISKTQQSIDTNTPIENNKQTSKQILYTITNSKNTNNNNNNIQEQTTTDEFFENGPHTNPEEIIVNITSSA